MKALLSGNEAIALGAFHAGVSVAAAYPGTPSTEILETMAGYSDLHAEWAPNEKVAMEVGLGASYAGARALVSMKHVGLNVAADPFFAAAITGVKGGLVVVSADDPGMHSSQNEQDNRHYARFAKVPTLEPSDSQEAYELTLLAFSLSEQFDTPVMIRPTTRVSHSKSVVEYDESLVPPRTRAAFARQPEKYVMIPAYARRRHPLVEERVARLGEYAESFPHNRMEMGDRGVGIIAMGVAYQYVREVMPQASFLKLGMGYPLPNRKIREFASQVERLIVVEELDPFVEEMVRGLGVQVEGKRYFPIVGELSTELVAEGFRQAGLLLDDAATRGHGDAAKDAVLPLPEGEGRGEGAEGDRGPGRTPGSPLRTNEASSMVPTGTDEKVVGATGRSPFQMAGADPGPRTQDPALTTRNPELLVAEDDGEASPPVPPSPRPPVSARPLPLRPPVLCPGCPHTAAFFTLKRLGFYRRNNDEEVQLPGNISAPLKRSGLIVAGDIGCYTLAALPPLLALDSCACMGASIGMAMGMEKAGLPNKAVAVIGDSTFLHSGITPLLDVVYNGGTITTIILDNFTTAMTGHQENPGTGLSAQGKRTPAADLELVVRGLGVSDVKVVNAFDMAAVEAALRDSIEREEPSVVIVRGDCSVKARTSGEPLMVVADECNGCSTCLRLGCPAIVRKDGVASIQPHLCVGAACGVCRQVCPLDAIVETSK